MSVYHLNMVTSAGHPGMGHQLGGLRRMGPLPLNPRARSADARSARLRTHAA
jgi:hypothetical protein